MSDQNSEIDHDFLASDKLLALWLEILNSYIAQAAELDKRKPDFFEFRQDRDALQRKFSETLMGELFRYSVIKGLNGRYARLTFSKKFLEGPFKNNVKTAFYISHDEIDEFFIILYQEMVAWVKQFELVKRDWGSLSVEDDVIIMNIAEREKVSREGFVPADFN